MAETTPAKTTRPSRARGAAATKATPAKAPPAAAKKLEETTVVVEPAAETPAADNVVGKLVLVKLPDTKSYSVFTPADGTGFVGKLYAPLGTEVVKVLATK